MEAVILSEGEASLIVILDSGVTSPDSPDTVLIIVCRNDSNCVPIDSEFDSRHRRSNASILKNRISIVTKCLEGDTVVGVIS